MISLVSLIFNPCGPNVFSEIISVNYASNTAVIRDNVILSFANVATANVLTSTQTIRLGGQVDIGQAGIPRRDQAQVRMNH